MITSYICIFFQIVCKFRSNSQNNPKQIYPINIKFHINYLFSVVAIYKQKTTHVVCFIFLPTKYTFFSGVKEY